MSNAIKKERLEVPIWHKPFLTIEEATAYTGIGICVMGRTSSNDKKRII